MAPSSVWLDVDAEVTATGRLALEVVHEVNRRGPPLGLRGVPHIQKTG